MNEQQQQTFKPGALIDGRYEVVRCLGAGSMGSVYACRHQDLSGSLVAVKVLYPEVARDRVSAARFKNEILASYKVSHPNVVRAFEFIKEGDLIAYSMEYVGGGDVADQLGNPDKPLSFDYVIRVLSEICLGVQAIHDAGIVHRDLKPENILLADDGHVKIADFGIAKAGGGPKLTEHGGVVGTLDYVSPEYMLNAQVDWRSDIYAIGVLAYEMTAGVAPFTGDSVYATMTKRLKSDPRPPSEVRAESPKELDRIIIRAMQRDPELRYQSAALMFKDLQSLSRALGFSGSHGSSASDIEERTAGGPRVVVESEPKLRGSIKLDDDGLPDVNAAEMGREEPTVGFGSDADEFSSQFRQKDQSRSGNRSSVDSALVRKAEEDTASFAIRSGKLEPILDSRPTPRPAFKNSKRRLTSDFPPPTPPASSGFRDSGLYDVGILVMAIVIGVAVGLVGIYMFAPHVFGR